MTHALVERMIRHRTVLAQDRAEHREQREDIGMRDYMGASRDLDRATIPFVAAVPAGWMIVGLAGMAPSFVAGVATPVALAVGIGGIMFAGRAISGVTSGARGQRCRRSRGRGPHPGSFGRRR